jgi:hypothetical protein
MEHQYQYQYQTWTPKLRQEINQAFEVCGKLYDIIDLRGSPDEIKILDRLLEGYDPGIDALFDGVVQLCHSFYEEHYQLKDGFDERVRRVLADDRLLKEMLIDFIRSNKPDFLRTVLHVSLEQATMYLYPDNKEMLERCNTIFYVSLMYRHERMVSMYVSLLPKNHHQTHFFIT